MPRPRLLLISASYVSEEPRKKLAALATHFDLTCVTCSHMDTPVGSHRFPAGSHPQQGYQLHSLDAWGRTSTTTRYLLPGLARFFSGTPWDLILVESEPWAWIRWQCWFLARTRQPRALFGEFSWENVVRPGWKGRLTPLVYALASRSANFIIAGNREAGSLFTQAGLPSEQLLVAPQLGVDTTLFHPIPPHERDTLRTLSGLPQKSLVVGFCGRFEPLKGIRDLLTAAETVRSRHPGLHLTLALIGDGSLAPELRTLQATRPWLHLLPPRKHADIASFMQMLDIFVLPSKQEHRRAHIWKEQFGHVLIEAMSCGVPSIGSSCGAIPEVVDDPTMIFPEGNADALARLLESLCLDPALRAAKGVAQRQLCLDRYTNPAISSSWARFLLSRLSPVPLASARVALLGDHYVRGWEGRPRRYFEQFPHGLARTFSTCFGLHAASDEALEQRLSFLKTQNQRILFGFLLSVFNLLRHYFFLLRSDWIICQSPHYFWWLVLLNRIGLFPVRRRQIRTVFFRQDGFIRKLPLFLQSPSGFKPFFITSTQTESLHSLGVPTGRLGQLDWKIDTHWYQPVPHPRRDCIICPGNVQRDEDLILALAGRVPRKLLRIGRLPFLKTFYRPASEKIDSFELLHNLDHPTYRDLIQNAALILLPIKLCDEPAGLTAALEALACGVPVLANSSMGVAPLLRAACHQDILPDLSPDTWIRAIDHTLSDPSAYTTALQARDYILAHHSIPNDPEHEWSPLLTP